MVKKEYDKFEVVFEENLIKVKSKITNWEDEGGTLLDEITYELDNSFGEANRKEVEGFLLAYSCTDEENAKKIIDKLPEQKKENGTKQDIVRNEAPIKDTRLDVVLDSASEKEIKDLFKIKLKMPSYQRPYRWTKRNIEFFWNDIKKSEEPYDFGIMVLQRKNGCEYDIVDGQQRIVTLSLMLRALSSDEANSFINNITLQGKDSEKNIGYNFQWFRREARKLDPQEYKSMIEKILKGYIDVVVMDTLDDSLKFFDRMNTTGVLLTETDILKSYHLLALESVKKLSNKVKKRWINSGFVPKESLNDINAFRKEVVIKWESLDNKDLTNCLGLVCILRMMKNGEYPGNDMYKIWDMEQFRNGNNPKAKYFGLDSPIANGEFFFWFVFRMHEEIGKYWESDNYDLYAARLYYLLPEKLRAREFFAILVIYLHEKFPTDFSTEVSSKGKKIFDLLFSWLVFYCVYYDRLEFNTIRNSALEDGSIFKAIVSSKTIDDCFDCYCENPLKLLESEGLAGRIKGNGWNYRIRRELRRIYG